MSREYSEKTGKLSTSADIPQYTARAWSHAIRGLEFAASLPSIQMWAMRVSNLFNEHDVVPDQIGFAGKRAIPEQNPQVEPSYQFTLETIFARSNLRAIPVASTDIMEDGANVHLFTVTDATRPVDGQPQIPLLLPVPADNAFEAVRGIYNVYLREFAQVQRLFTDTHVRLDMQAKASYNLPRFDRTYPLWYFLSQLPYADALFRGLYRRDPNVTMLGKSQFNPMWFIALEDTISQKEGYDTAVSWSYSGIETGALWLRVEGTPVCLFGFGGNKPTVEAMALGYQGQPDVDYLEKESIEKRDANALVGIFPIIDSLTKQRLNAMAGVLESVAWASGASASFQKVVESCTWMNAATVCAMNALFHAKVGDILNTPLWR